MKEVKTMTTKITYWVVGDSNDRCEDDIEESFLNYGDALAFFNTHVGKAYYLRLDEEVHTIENGEHDFHETTLATYHRS